MIWIASCIKIFFATEFVDMFPQTNGDIFTTVHISLDRFPKTDINQHVSIHVETVVGLHRKDI